MSAKFPRGGGAGPFLARSLFHQLLVPDACLWLGPPSPNCGLSKSHEPFSLFHYSVLDYF